MVEFLGNNLKLRFDYEGRYGHWSNVVLCCTQDRMYEATESCLAELCEHYSDVDASYLDDWAVQLCQAIIKAAGFGYIDHMGKRDLVFDIGRFLEADVVEELKFYDDECEEHENM